jgi:hypothetical protein
LQYTALLAASRSPLLQSDWIISAIEIVSHHAVENTKSFAAHLTAKGAVAFLVAVGSQNETNRQMVLGAIGALKNLPAEKYLCEEAEWQLNSDK